MNSNTAKLSRILGFWPVYGAAVGLVVSATAMVSVGNVAGMVGYASIITGLIAFIPMLATAFAYSELTAMLPGSGMVSDYTMPALGRFWSIFAILSAYVVLISADGGIQHIIGGVAIQSLTGIPQYIASWILLIVIVVVNLFGVGLYGKTEAFLTVGMMLTFLTIGVLGIFGVGEAMGVAVPLSPRPSFIPAETTAIFMAVGVAIWWFIGFEFACPIAEENVAPHRNIPKALLFGLVSILLIKASFAWVATTYTPSDILLGSSIPHVDAARLILGQGGYLAMSIVTILSAFTTLNAYMAGLPRMLYGMARERLAPKAFSYIHPKFRTPWIGIFFTTALMMITILYTILRGAGIDLIMFLIMTACVCWMVSYSIVMIDVIILRKKYPDYPRLWKAPFALASMVIGLLGVAFAIWTLQFVWWSAGILMAVIAAYTVIWLKIQKLPLAEKTPIEEIALEIMNRSEELPEWDNAVREWIERRKASGAYQPLGQ